MRLRFILVPGGDSKVILREDSSRLEGNLSCDSAVRNSLNSGCGVSMYTCKRTHAHPHGCTKIQTQHSRHSIPTHTHTCWDVIYTMSNRIEHGSPDMSPSNSRLWAATCVLAQGLQGSSCEVMGVGM